MHLAVVDAGRHIVPTAERGHHGLRARRQRAGIAGPVDGQHLGAADLGDALVAAPVGAAVADEMLGSRHDIAVLVELALQAFDISAAKPPDQGRVLGKTLVRAAPARVAGHRQRGREHPLDARGTHGPRRRLAQLAHEARIGRCTQADVVREQRRPENVVVSVDGVRAPDQRNRHLPTGH